MKQELIVAFDNLCVEAKKLYLLKTAAIWDFVAIAAQQEKVLNLMPAFNRMRNWSIHDLKLDERRKYDALSMAVRILTQGEEHRLTPLNHDYRLLSAFEQLGIDAAPAAQRLPTAKNRLSM